MTRLVQRLGMIAPCAGVVTAAALSAAAAQSPQQVMPSGQPVLLGGATTETHAVTRHILSIGAGDTASDTTVALTAVVLGGR